MPKTVHPILLKSRGLFHLAHAAYRVRLYSGSGSDSQSLNTKLSLSSSRLPFRSLISSRHTLRHSGNV